MNSDIIWNFFLETNFKQVQVEVPASETKCVSTAICNNNMQQYSCCLLNLQSLLILDLFLKNLIYTICKESFAILHYIEWISYFKLFSIIKFIFYIISVVLEKYFVSIEINSDLVEFIILRKDEISFRWFIC